MMKNLDVGKEVNNTAWTSLKSVQTDRILSNVKIMHNVKPESKTTLLKLLLQIHVIVKQSHKVLGL